jgi:F-type H+-transporting ATPase subunit epsilon
MKLVISTPARIVVTASGVVHVRAEDESGSFGIMPRHADLVTALTTSVVTWRVHDGRERHCAVRGGVLTVAGGDVAIATREAVPGDDLETLEHDVLERFRRAVDEAARARVETERLRAAAIRAIQRYLRPPSRGFDGGTR